MLDEVERFRLEKLKDDDAQRQYLVAHVLLRTSLSYIHPLKPSEWRFGRTTSGQPVIRYPQSIAPLFFSLSHTRSLVVCAVSPAYRVGVDTEKIENSLDISELVPHVFSEYEREWLQCDEVPVRLRRFYQLWTLKESLLKAVGVGLKLPPSHISFRFSDASPELSQLPAEFGHRGEWTFRIFEPTQAHICALTVETQTTKSLTVSRISQSIKELIGYAQETHPTD